MIILYAFIIGLAVGSFLNVVILRGWSGEHLGGRSRCDSCGKILSVQELFPVVSFLIQKARCRSCGTALSWQYPIVELTTAVSYALAAWVLMPEFVFSVLPWVWLVAAYAGVAAIIVILVADIRFQIIPDGAVLILLAVGIFASIMRHAFLPDAIAALGGSAFFFSLWLVSGGRWMGLGDAKLSLAASLIVGFPASVAAFLFSFWLGGAAAVPLLLLGKKGLRSRIPFGPFIIAGAALAWIWGDAFLVFAGLMTLW